MCARAGKSGTVLGFRLDQLRKRNRHMQALWTRARYVRLCSMAQMESDVMAECVGTTPKMMAYYIDNGSFPIPICLLFEQIEQSILTATLGQKWLNPEINPAIGIRLAIKTLEVIARGDCPDPVAAANLALEKLPVYNKVNPSND